MEGLKGYIYIEAYKQTHVKQVKIIKKLWLIYGKFLVRFDQSVISVSSISLFTGQSLFLLLVGIPQINS